MNRSALFLIFASLFITVAKATNHTTCFNYFLKKDRCVFSSADERTRCKAPPKQHPSPVKQFALVSQDKRSLQGGSLARRYDAKKPVFPIGGGTGNCGFYNSTAEIGVCLWSGAELKNPTVQTAGWINSLKTSNCGKRIYIQRTGKPETVQYARVLDGCSFDTRRLNVGCFQIGITVELFNKFKPSAKEISAQLLLDGVTWDFDNLNGTSTQQGPV
ncbi:hypothetical protein PCANC_09893 [Puccinia coronata f. sp. avenae]|uniref:Secreted protein n=1 Tax=Puccinia coronata f. sp. avenae TaxID=200324 RepID=A0A2N5UXD4_9BASI|nr:hypothetical protein PCANC_26603 [Puccinia coronata f. sp. avenae]PLW41719.1 hypothetical protein PCASD_05688 [Puccinia coronata f. sp. avenae]PLW42405.1 hypothetical protein PCANC_09893 [Puccinia coronata f. sp. avenae]